MAQIAPSFTLTRTFRLSDADFDAAFVLDLLQNRGFHCVNGSGLAKKTSGSAARVKVRRLRRRRKKTALTAERIREFKKARTDGKSYRRIGAIFGVSEGRAWQIVNRGK